MLAMLAFCALAALVGRLVQVDQQASSLRRDLALERDKTRAVQAEVSRERQELEILHGRLGKLTIHDPNAIYLVALAARDQFEWKWRLHLPPGNRWRVVARHGILADDRLTFDPDASGQFDAIVGLAGGEHDVDAFISRDLMAQRSVVVQVGDYTLRTPLSPDHERLILDNKYGSQMQAGRTYHLDENNPLINKAPYPLAYEVGKVELLLWKVMADSSGRDGHAIQIWIEPDAPPPLVFGSGPPLGQRPRLAGPKSI